MKILYLAHLINKEHRDSDEDIKLALELNGHKVIPVEDRKDWNDVDLLKTIEKEKPDMFLFHKGGVSGGYGSVQYNLTLTRLMRVLDTMVTKYPKIKRVFWYVDKVWGDREQWMESVIPFVDYGFMVDETFIRRHRYTNLYPLKQGAPEHNTKKGKKNKKYQCDISFVGSPYGPRAELISGLSNRFKDVVLFVDSFKQDGVPKENQIVNRPGFWDREWFDFAESTKILVAPAYPSDAFYWSARVYMALGAGCFVLHPHLHGFNKEFTPNVHFASYRNGDELLKKITFFLKNDKARNQIRLAGQKRCLKLYKYSDRIKAMFDIIEPKKESKKK